MNAIEVIRTRRKEKKFTQEDLANVLGVKRSTYSDIENQRIQLKADDLIKLCCFLDLTFEAFIGKDSQCVILKQNEINALISIANRLKK